jgi:hypothetical protein
MENILVSLLLGRMKFMGSGKWFLHVFEGQSKCIHEISWTYICALTLSLSFNEATHSFSQCHISLNSLGSQFWRLVRDEQAFLVHPTKQGNFFKCKYHHLSAKSLVLSYVKKR